LTFAGLVLTRYYFRDPYRRILFSRYTKRQSKSISLEQLCGRIYTKGQNLTAYATILRDLSTAAVGNSHQSRCDVIEFELPILVRCMVPNYRVVGLVAWPV